MLQTLTVKKYQAVVSLTNQNMQISLKLKWHTFYRFSNYALSISCSNLLIGSSDSSIPHSIPEQHAKGIYQRLNPAINGAEGT